MRCKREAIAWSGTRNREKHTPGDRGSDHLFPRNVDRLARGRRRAFPADLPSVGISRDRARRSTSRGNARSSPIPGVTMNEEWREGRKLVPMSWLSASPDPAPPRPGPSWVLAVVELSKPTCGYEIRWRKRKGIEPSKPLLAQSFIGFEDRAAHQLRTRFHRRRYMNQCGGRSIASP